MATEAEIIPEPISVLMSKVEVIEDRDPSPEEKGGSIEDEMSRNAIEANKQDGNLEHKEQDSITNLDPKIDSSNDANEIVTEAGQSDLVREKLEEKNLDEIEDTKTEKLSVLEGKEEGTEATDPIETSISEKDQIVSDSIEDTLTSKAAETEQHPIADISNSSVSDETVKESTKEDESISLESTEKASSSVELEDSKKDIEEGSTDTADQESAPVADETLQDEQPSDLGLEKEKIEDLKLSDKATDVEKVIQEEEVKQETEVPEGGHGKNPEVMNMNDNGGQSKETILEPSKSQSDETITDVQKEETEKKINEEPEDKPEDEQNTNEVTKVKDNSSVSNECLKEGDSRGQVEAKNTEAEEYSTEEREASLVVESEKSAPEPEANEVEVTEVMPTGLDLEPEVNEVKVTKAVPTELALELQVNEVEQTKAVATELASEPEVKEAEETKAVATELASEPEVNEVGETKAVPRELALEPEVKEVEETKAVPTELISETAEICLEKEESNEVEDGKKDETDATARDIEVEESKDQSLASALPEAVVDHETTVSYETVETELKKDDSPEKIEEQTTELTVQTLKDVANNNVEKQIVAEDQTVKEQEQTQVATKEATIVPGEEKTDDSGVETNPEPAPATSTNISLSDLLQRSEEEKTEVDEHVIEERELTVSKEAAPPVEDAENIQANEAKPDEVQEGDEHNKTDSGSDAPVMVEAPRDTETKPHKKSQNIVSKAISKVRKVITGKSSSNSKEPKATSPKGGEK